MFFLFHINSRRARAIVPIISTQQDSDDSEDLPIATLATLIQRNPMTAPPDTCIVCMSRKRAYVMVPCGHYNICKQCYDTVKATRKRQFKLDLREWNERRSAFDSDDSDFDDPKPVDSIRCVECQSVVEKAVVVFQN